MSDFTPADPNFERRIRGSFARQGIMGHIGAEMGEVGPGSCEIRLPYGDHLSQQHGFFHGGVVATIANAGVLTVEFKINLMVPAHGDVLIARGRVLRPGRTLTVSHADVFVVHEGRERACAILQQTLMTITGRSDVVG